MNLFLIGYMASGKSTIGKLLASRLMNDFIDLDAYIEAEEGMNISSLFSEKGEIYFRKKEVFYLKKLAASKKHTVIALGGGTPCYGDTMKYLKSLDNAVTIYLKLSITELTERLLNEKEHRPLVSHLKSREEFQEFIGKHIFERQYFYNQADYVIDINNCSTQDSVEKIVMALF